jgi:hypothetical protein
MAVELLSVSHAPKRVAEESRAPAPAEASYTPTSEYEEPSSASEGSFSGAETVETPYVPAEPVTDPAASSSDDYIAEIAEPETTAPPADQSSLLSEPGSYGELAQEPPVSPPGRRRYGQDADLPVDVANDEERRLHNDARRFARLLISEIKLYNEQKVVEGRSEHDLYDRLREYIDRSREMYDKRVKAEVAARYDYFHGELVNTLAEGDASKLGSNYPGATVNA